MAAPRGDSCSQKVDPQIIRSVGCQPLTRRSWASSLKCHVHGPYTSRRAAEMNLKARARQTQACLGSQFPGAGPDRIDVPAPTGAYAATSLPRPGQGPVLAALRVANSHKLKLVNPRAHTRLASRFCSCKLSPPPFFYTRPLVLPEPHPHCLCTPSYPSSSSHIARLGPSNFNPRLTSVLPLRSTKRVDSIHAH